MNHAEEGSKTLRNVAMGAVAIIVALAAGFGTGYFSQDRRVQELTQLMANQKETMTAQITALEKQVLEAQKTQLERALARAKLKADLDEVLGLLAAAAVEVEQRNFGLALQKIGAAKGALTAGGTPVAIRESVGTKLDEIRAGLEQLDVKVREQIITLGKELEEGALPVGSSQ